VAGHPARSRGVPAKLLLAGQTGPAITERLAGQVEVQPTPGGNDHQRLPGPGPHRQGLEHLADLDAERPRLIDRRLGLSMRDHLEDVASLLEVLGDDRHRCHLLDREVPRRPGGRLPGETHAAVLVPYPALTALPIVTPLPAFDGAKI
jgi:hypothetical protein